VSFSEVEIEEIGAQPQDLTSAYQKKQPVNACLDNCTDCSKFDHAWHMLGEEFTRLRNVAGGAFRRFSKHSNS
jgi:hypothetical protein